MSRVLVTGAGGFVGSNLCRLLKGRGDYVLGVVRELNPSVTAVCDECIAVGDISRVASWSELLKGIDYVVHLAARVHFVNERDNSLGDLYHSTNVVATRQLAEDACRANVKCLLFLSSIGVNGSHTRTNPFRDDDAPAPESLYAASKMAAEQAIKAVCRISNTSYVIIRPPLVYGFGAPGNFRALVKLVKSRVPLPFLLVKNRRDFIGVENLCAFITECIDNPKAYNNTFLAADGDPVSTRRLVEILSSAIGQRAYMFPVPPRVLRAILVAIGRPNASRQVIDNLEIDCGLARSLLDWQAPMTLEQGIYSAVREPSRLDEANSGRTGANFFCSSSAKITK